MRSSGAKGCLCLWRRRPGPLAAGRLPCPSRGLLLRTSGRGRLRPEGRAASEAGVGTTLVSRGFTIAEGSGPSAKVFVLTEVGNTGRSVRARPESTHKEKLVALLKVTKRLVVRK